MPGQRQDEADLGLALSAEGRKEGEAREPVRASRGAVPAAGEGEQPGKALPGSGVEQCFILFLAQTQQFRLDLAPGLLLGLSVREAALVL